MGTLRGVLVENQGVATPSPPLTNEEPRGTPNVLVLEPQIPLNLSVLRSPCSPQQLEP